MIIWLLAVRNAIGEAFQGLPLKFKYSVSNYIKIN